jgi:glycosyltransferase involved in cell wall biosynthesis
VLHLSYFGRQGGSGGAVSMRRLHEGLKGNGVQSKVLCITGKGADSDYFSVDSPERDGRFKRYQKSLARRIGLTGFDGVPSSAIKKHEAYIDADVLNIHRFLGVISYLGLPSLTKDKPSVLTLCDTWALTGRCYNNMDCSRWKTGCGACPYKNIFPVTRRDASRLEWHLKHWAYDHSRLTLVSKSSWMTRMLQHSILKNFDVFQIPNGIDLQTYQCLDKNDSRAFFKIPEKKHVLMFGAVDLRNFIKGGDLLFQAMEKLPGAVKSKIVLIIMGNNSAHVSNIAGIETIELGYLNNAEDKNRAYSAADLFLCPSRGEVLNNAIIEAMASGTPAVAFKVGGIPDLVRPGITGYLAKPWDTHDFCRGIVELLHEPSGRTEMAKQCRQLVVDEFSLDLQITRYRQLYRKLVS